MCIYQESMVNDLLPRGSAYSSAFFFLQSLTNFVNRVLASSGSVTALLSLFNYFQLERCRLARFLAIVLPYSTCQELFCYTDTQQFFGTFHILFYSLGLYKISRASSSLGETRIGVCLLRLLVVFIENLLMRIH